MQRARRLVSVLALVSLAGVLPMCGSDDGKKVIGATGGEGGGRAGEQAGGASSRAGAPSEGGSAGEASVSGGAGGSAGQPGGEAGAGANGLGGAANGLGGAEPGSGGAGLCVEAANCCPDAEEAPCTPDWEQNNCGSSMELRACCDAATGERRACAVEYFSEIANYETVYSRASCSCAADACECSCDSVPVCFGRPACTPGWDANCASFDTSCCDPELGVIHRCDYPSGDRTEKVQLDECLGVSYGTGTCIGCLGADDGQCDEIFLGTCGVNGVQTCSNYEEGYRLSCDDGQTTVLCTCAVL